MKNYNKFLEIRDMVLITTSKSFISLDHRLGTIEILHSSCGHYYGVTRCPGGWLVGHRNRSNASTIPKHQEHGEILFFGDNFSLKSTMKPDFQLIDIHQIIYHDGILYVTCPFENMIAIFDGAWRKWFPVGRIDSIEEDVNHFNSIAIFEDELILVAHNRGRPSELMFFGIRDFRFRRSVQLGLCAHNAWLHDGELMTCSSREGRLLGAHGSMVETGGFPRGIAYVGDEIVVGLSEFKTRADRDDSRGTILVYDRKWSLLRQFDLGREGMVTDIAAQ